MAIVASRSSLLNAHACAGISASASSRASFRMARFLLRLVRCKKNTCLFDLRCRRAQRSPLRRDRQLESIRVAQTEHARAPRRVIWLRFQRATELLDPSRNLIDVLIRRNVQREPLAFDSVPTPRSVVLI